MKLSLKVALISIASKHDSHLTHSSTRLYLTTIRTNMSVPRDKFVTVLEFGSVHVLCMDGFHLFNPLPHL